MREFLGSLVVLVLGFASVARGAEAEKNGSEPLLDHNVYFALTDHAPASVQKLVAACKKYLTGHEGIVFFAVGTRAEELTRAVNDKSFDVSLHIVFKNKAAHDKYQDSERHHQFITESKENWKNVRVFDSLVEQVPNK